MSKMNNKKMSPFRKLMILLFGNRNKLEKKIDLLQEEQIVSPVRTVIRTFRSNRLSMAALIIFLMIAVSVVVLPLLYPVDLSYTEETQKNLPPYRGLLSLPKEMEHNPRSISVGSSFTVGVDENGDAHFWGLSKGFSMPELKDIPEKAQGVKWKKISAGFDHVIGLAEDGRVFAWGNGRLQQTRLDRSVTKPGLVENVYAGHQYGIAITKDHETKLLGAPMNLDYTDEHDYQGKISKVALGISTVVGLTTDGEIVYLGMDNGGAYARVPQGKNFVDVAAGSRVFAALDSDGKVQFWGNISHRGEDQVPEHSSPIVKIEGGQYHFTALLADGSVISWGDKALKQSDAPDVGHDAKDIYAGYYQNYIVKNDGKVVPFGFKGYILGSDEFGRDVFTRIMNGGRLTLTIGTVAVIISTVLGTILGGVSGFFGGRVDMGLQRLGEIVNSLPFLPTIIILNSLIGNKMTSSQRIYLIMVLLGLLSWVGLMRLVRAQVLSVREQEFVTAARAMGIKKMSIVFRHIIPNVISIIIVSATLSFAGSLLTEATLSFLGFGVQAPQPTWGNMILGATDSTILKNFWWRWLFPSVILSVCVICINLIGTGLDDAIDPKSQER